MPSGNVLQEFLVKLGYVSDDESYRKWTAQLANVSKRVTEFGAAATATALEIEAFVDRVSKRMTDLYYASEKAHTSALNLDSLRYAAQGIGIGADAATSAVTTLANKLRENPGNEGFLNSIGVHTRDANHQLLDMNEIFINLLD